MRPLYRTASRALASAKERLTRWPGRRHWREVLALAALFTIAAGLTARLSPELRATLGDGPPALPGLAGTMLAAVFVPALAEELVFRGLLQPARLKGLWSHAASVASLAAFVAWHPVQVRLGLPYAQPVFLSPDFLWLAGLLGVFATFSVHRSGSLWPAVLLHWFAVLLWKLAGG